MLASKTSNAILSSELNLFSLLSSEAPGVYIEWDKYLLIYGHYWHIECYEAKTDDTVLASDILMCFCLRKMHAVTT